MSALPQPPFSNPNTPQEVSRRPPAGRPRWKRILAWAGAGIGVLIVVVVVGIYILLHSSKVHAYLLRTAQAKATEGLGSEVQFRDYGFRWSGLGPSVELYDVVVHGAPPYSNPPLLRADLLRVQVTISSFLHRSWYVNDIEIRGPIVRIFADSQGRTNLLQTNSKPSSRNKVDIFQLGIRHLALQHGEIYYNNQKSELAADLRDLAFQLGFRLLEKKYSGAISYRHGHVQWQRNNPIEHDFDARFSLTAEQFALENAELRAGGSHVTVRATAENYALPRVRADYEASLDAGEARRIFNQDSLPSGVVGISGKLDYQNDPGQPFLATTTLHGALHSRGLVISLQNRSLGVSSVAANYSLVAGNARVAEIRARALEGVLTGDLTIRDVAGTADSHLNASLKNASMAELQNFAQPSSRNHAVLSGTLTASTEASWQKALANLTATAQLQIAAGMLPARSQDNIPVNGMIRARYDAARETLAIVGQNYVRTPQTSLSLDGTVGKRSTLQIRFQSAELREIEEIANAFRAPGAPPLGLQGQASAQATVNGSTRSPQAHGQLTASNVRVRSTSWKSLRLQFAASPTSVRVAQGELVPASRGKITYQLDVGLQKWAFIPSSFFRAKLQASDLDAKELAQAAGVATQVSGNLAVDMEVHGTQLAPAGKGTIQLVKARVADEPIKTVRADFQADGAIVSAKARIDLAAGSAMADIHYEPRQQIYEAIVRSTGIKLEELETIKARNMQLTGTLTIEATGRGTLNDPGLQTTVRLPQLNIRNQSINNIQLTAGVTNHVAKFTLDAETMGTQAGAEGTIQLTGDYPADVTLNTQVIPLQPVFAIYLPSGAPNLTGQTEIHATLRGPLKNKAQLEAHIEVPQLTLNYKNSITVAARGPISADYVQGTLNLKRSSITGTGTSLTFEANIPSAKDAPTSILLQGSVDLRLAQLFSSDLTSGGRLEFNIDSTGRRSDPTVQGQVKIVDASFTQAGTPLGLRAGNGVLTLTRDRLEVTEFKGQVGGGTVTASGRVLYRPALHLDLAMKAEGVRALYQQSIRASLNSDLALTGDYDNSLLRGQVSIEQLSFTSNFDLMSFAGQLGGGEATPPPTGGFTENLHLEVAVETPGGLNLSSRDLSVAGSADLHVRGTASQPVILGRMNLSDGDLIFYGNRYLILGGTVDFSNPSRTEPVLDMAATTTIRQYDIQMHFWGPADHLLTNYSSDPALPPSDIINLIAFGKTTEAAAANPTPPGTLGAQSLVASQLSSQVTSRIEKLAGISQLSVDPVLGSSQQSPGARIAVQQRVTGKIFVTFSTDVTSTQQQVIQVEYQMNRRTSIKAVRDQNGGFSLQTSFRKEW